MKTARQYLFSALLPAITVFITGLIRMPKDCGQCVALLFAGSGLVFIFLLLLGLSYFLMLIKLQQSTTRIFVGLAATFNPSVILTIALFRNYYDPGRNGNTDFEIASPAIVAAFFVSVWTFYLYMKDNPVRLLP